MNQAIGRQSKLDSVNAIAERIHIRPFNHSEIELITEYCNLLEPVAQLLDIFQTEKPVFAGIGIVLPLLVKLKLKLNSLTLNNFTAIREKILKRVEERYNYHYKSIV